MSAEVINLSCYKFAPLDGLEELRTSLQELTKAHGLKGTILLAPEGVNFFLAGTRPQLAAVLQVIRAVPGLADIAPKESPSFDQPFKRMLVKIKKEIIAFGVEGVDPARRPAKKISAQQLKQWLDEGRPVTLLDTRNDYEVRMGTFKGAVVSRIWNFRDFPAAVEKLPEELKTQPVVMFCTGGIRCEKASAYLLQRGFSNVHHLRGGILRYLEEMPEAGSSWHGECFVFDRRVALNHRLEPGRHKLCHACGLPLAPADLNHPAYRPGVSCHHCIARFSDADRARFAERQRQLELDRLHGQSQLGVGLATALGEPQPEPGLAG